MMVGAEIIFVCCFYDNSLIFYALISIHEYANSSICTSDHVMKDMYLSLNLVPSLEVNGK